MILGLFLILNVMTMGAFAGDWVKNRNSNSSCTVWTKVDTYGISIKVKNHTKRYATATHEAWGYYKNKRIDKNGSFLIPPGKTRSERILSNSSSYASLRKHRYKWNVNFE